MALSTQTKQDIWMARIGLIAAVIAMLSGHVFEGIILSTMTYWGLRSAR